MQISQTPPAELVARSRSRATLDEWLAIPEEQRAELIDGRIVYQGMPGPIHGRAQTRIAGPLSGAYDRRPGGGASPGGWWFSLEVDMDIAGLGCRPDILAWRRDKQPKLPEPDARGLVTAAPDWICEVLSRSTAPVDMGGKRLGYHRAGVAYYWIADPVNRTLTVLEWTAAGYLVALVAGCGDKVRAEPFPEMEIDVDDLFDEETPGPTGEAAR
jgi:Uma2 family endonuclease